jgi:hypothetical protein
MGHAAGAKAHTSRARSITDVILMDACIVAMNEPYQGNTEQEAIALLFGISLQHGKLINQRFWPLLSQLQSET